MTNYLLEIVSSILDDNTSNIGRNNKAKINENTTVIAVTKPKSCTTGIGENNNTRNPHTVVLAERTNATPVVLYTDSNASQASPDDLANSISYLLHTCIV